MKNPELYWKSNDGDIKVSEMDTTHLINTVKMINKMSYRVNGRNEDFEYPECFDNMMEELEKRGIDPDIVIEDFALNNMFPSLNEES